MKPPSRRASGAVLLVLGALVGLALGAAWVAVAADPLAADVPIVIVEACPPCPPCAETMPSPAVERALEAIEAVEAAQDAAEIALPG